MSNVPKKPLYQTVNGIFFPSMFSPDCIKEAFGYKAQPDDIFIVTYPKSGTTWMQNIMLYLFRRGEPFEDLKFHSGATPFLDLLGNEGVRLMPRPGVIKTHLPFNHMPYSAEAKYIFVARKPKDVCVSLYHHTTMFPGYGYSNGEFDDFFELFMASQVEYNDYFDHLLSWFPHRHEKNIFYTTYEAMKKDIKDVIVRLGHFVGKEYGVLLEKDNNILNNIIHLSSFKYMQENVSDSYDSYGHRESILNDPDAAQGLKYLVQFTCSLELPEDRPQMNFIRKGIVGDWKNYFSLEQAERLDNKFEEKNIGANITSLWM